jgi:hypothetical protein
MHSSSFLSVPLRHWAQAMEAQTDLKVTVEGALS